MKPLAVQLYSVRDQMDADADATLRRIAGIGYRAVEPTLNLVGDPQRFRATLDELGVIAPSLHAPVLDDGRDDAAAAAGVIGAETLIVPFLPAERFADAGSIAEVAGRLADAATWAAGHGLRLGYHNHQWELAARVDGRPALEVLAEHLPAEVLLEVDLYWATVGGVDVVALLRALGERVAFLHVKDGPATADDPMTAVGAGTLDIPALLAAAPASAWRIVELDRCATDVVEAVAASFDYLSGLEPAGAAS